MRTVVAGLVLLGVLAAPAAAHDVDVDVVSSRADQVSGGDALIRIEARHRHKLRVFRNGADVTGAFERDGRDLVGLVDGLRLGRNRISVYDGWRRVARQTLVNHPIEGPDLLRPAPEAVRLQDDPGRARRAAGRQPGGRRLPRARAGRQHRRLEPQLQREHDASTGSTAERPAATSCRSRRARYPPTWPMIDEDTPFIVRRERGTINRFIYSFAMLADPATDASRWNRRLVYFFDGGVAIGRNQGTPGGSALNPDLLARGYAIAHSSGTRASVHYNMVLGGETALMTKERFVERYGVPLYTVGIGGSGGAIQQYLYGQNHRGPARRRDPDALVSRHGHADHPRRRLRAARALHGRHRRRATRSGRTGRTASGSRASTSATFPNPFTGRPGNSECIIGWRGLTPLAMNPLFGTAGAGTERMDPAVMAAVHWTHWEDVKNVYGVGPDGYARQTWDNVGVQYGLKALTDGNITPGRVPRPQRQGRLVEGPRRHGPGGPAVPARRTASTRGACATSRPATRRRGGPARSRR